MFCKREKGRREGERGDEGREGRGERRRWEGGKGREETKGGREGERGDEGREGRGEGETVRKDESETAH